MQQNDKIKSSTYYYFLAILFFFFTKIRTVNLWKWTFHSVVQLKTWEDRNRPRDLGHLHLHNLIMLPFPTYFPIAAAKVIVVKRYVCMIYIFI